MEAEIKEQTLVVIVEGAYANNLGVVQGVLPHDDFSVRVGIVYATVNKKQIVPLLNYIPPTNTDKILRRELPKVIVNLTLMITDLQRQVEKLHTELQFQRTGPEGIEAL